MLDTSLGLVNIIREYFSFKAKFTEFLRVCPKSPIIIELIETEDTLSRLNLILQTFKENLHKFDKVPAKNPKKRQHSNSVDDGEDFNVSNTNTSTPETMNVAKKRRRSVTTPFVAISASKDVKTKTVDQASTSRAALGYVSSTDTSSKDGDDEEEEEEEGAANALIIQNTASPAAQVLTQQNDVRSLNLFFVKAENNFPIF